MQKSLLHVQEALFDHEYTVLLETAGGSPDHLAPVRSRPAVAAEDQAPAPLAAAVAEDQAPAPLAAAVAADQAPAPLAAAVAEDQAPSLVAAAAAEDLTPFPVVVCEWTRPAAVGQKKSLLQLQEALLRRGILKVGREAGGVLLARVGLGPFLEISAAHGSRFRYADLHRV